MKETETKESVEEQILKATIECIERDGIHKVTTRSIAKEANVNSAAINYYFRSKDNLISRALQRALDEAFVINVEEELGEDTKDLLAGMIQYFTINLWGGITYPNLVKAQFIENRENMVARLSAFLDIFTQKIVTLIPHRNEKELKMAVVQMMSAVMFTSFVPEIMEDFLDIDTKDFEKLKEFVLDLASHYTGTSTA